MTTDYDPNVLQQYADEVHRQAKWIVFWTALRYGVIGLLVIGVAAGLIASLNPANVSPSALAFGPPLGLAVGIFAGVDAGRRRAFNLKLQAQQLLCQRKIEFNIRTAV